MQLLRFHPLFGLPASAWFVRQLIGIFFQNQANKEDQFKSKVDERNRKAELVRQNKLKVEESGDLVPESA